ncbi:MAG: RNA polymerase sigma factor, partial [Myxococcales bacterium]
HIPFLKNFSRYLTRDRATAEDLTQETLLVAIEKFDQLRDPDKCRAWLGVILRNLYLGTIQKSKRERRLDYHDLTDILPADSNWRERMGRDGFSDRVQHQLDRMSGKYRQALVMKVFGEYSYKEIAQELDIPLGTVMSRINRGRSFLREGIGNRAGENRVSRIL